MKKSVDYRIKKKLETHWKQCFIPFYKPLQVRAGNNITIEFKMKLRDSNDDSFSFDIKVVELA